MQINLNDIRVELIKQGQTQKDLAEYLGINNNTLVSIFRRNDCTIRQFEKMITFFGCSGLKLADFILNNAGQTYSEEIQILINQRQYYESKAREVDHLRSRVLDKERVIKLSDAIKKLNIEHEQEINNLKDELNKCSQRNAR